MAVQVLRLTAGEEVELADGLGWTARAKILTAHKKAVELLIERETYKPQNKFLRGMLVGLPKPGALDEVVQVCVEAGVDFLVIFRGERSTSRQEIKLEKIRKQILEYSRITKSAWNLQVFFADHLSAAMEMATELCKPEQTEVYVCDERPAHAPDDGEHKHLFAKLLASHHRAWLCVVGPESSFSQSEYDFLESFSSQRALCFVGLGPRILRTPAAVGAACWLMSACVEARE